MKAWPSRLLAAGTILVLASAPIVAFGVIPDVRSDTFPGATPDRAIPAFWAAVVLDLLAVAGAWASIRVAYGQAGPRRVLSGGAGLLALLLGLILIDAAAAYVRHGPAMHGADVALWACVCLNVVGGALILVATFLDTTPVTPRTEA